MTARNNFLLWIAACFLSLTAWIGSAGAAELLPVPEVAYVTDSAHILSAEQKRALETKLNDFERAYGSQIGVIIVPTLNGETIEDYAHRVGDSWKLGRKNIGDGLLFVVSVNDRRARLDVNRALEGAIPDVAASRILNETVFPSFKVGNYYQGISRGLDQVFMLIKGENLPAPDPDAWGKHERADGDPLWDQPWIAIMFIGFVATMMLRQLLGKKKAAPFAGLAVGAFGAFVMQSLVAGLIIAAIVVTACLLIPDEVLEAGEKRSRRIYRTRRRSRNQWDNFGGGGFGGMGGGFGGDGGFGGMGGGAGSGGGGDSAGGGASGSW